MRHRAPDLGVRFVEKLGTVAAALGGGHIQLPLSTQATKRLRNGVNTTVEPSSDSIPPLDSNSSGTLSFPFSSDGHADGWLDDKALNALTYDELQELMDSFIGTFMRQLVQLASVDAELRHELNSLDKR